MQTDPNFGNYLVRLGNGQDIQDKIVLLDFGAIRQFDEHLLSVARNLIQAGYQHDKHAMVQAMTGYEFSMQCLKVLNPAWPMCFTCDRSIQYACK